MSRRKQPKPQHHMSDEDPLQTDAVSENVLSEAVDEEEDGGGRGDQGGRRAHVCERCCAEFFSLAELTEHQSGCPMEYLVLVVKEDERTSPGGLSPAPSFAPSDPADMEQTDAVLELVETENNRHGLDVLEEEEEDESMDLEEHRHDGEREHRASSPQPSDSTESASPLRATVASYGMPTTNVTLGILRSTRVAVAQFSHGIHKGRVGGRAATAAISAILEHLLALQQQQVHQLRLIEQICGQVDAMNRRHPQTPPDPASRSLSLAPSDSSVRLLNPPVPPLLGMPLKINGQTSDPLASVLETSQRRSSHAVSGHSTARDGSTTDVPSARSPRRGGGTSTIQPPSAATPSSAACSQTRSSFGPRPPGDGSFPSSPSDLPLPPQSPPGGIVFPSPLASMAAAAKTFEPLAVLLNPRGGKPPDASAAFDAKPSPDGPFFKHKCRFCAKAFGSDSALQIHLRSHTGERPFKCNICGNRFSTKGNLKVHFQRHKDKYPHVQMNPYPVPEYLDNMPTSLGIPYGMSFPPEKKLSSWLDNKPDSATVSACLGHQLPASLCGVGNSSDSMSTTPSLKSPRGPGSSERASLSPNAANNEENVPPAPGSPPSEVVEGGSPPGNVTRSAEVHLPQNCSSASGGSPFTKVTGMPPTAAPTAPELGCPASSVAFDPSPLSPTSDRFKASFPFGRPLDSTEASETSKLQRLVENIDKTTSDPNQCVVCHRVLSCLSALRMHHRIHTGERPFRCKLCGRAFTTKGNLKTHVGVHRANPSLRTHHTCPICQRKLTNAVVLQQHIRRHTGRQPPGNNPQANPAERLPTADSADLYLHGKNFHSPGGHDREFMDGDSMEDDDGREDDEEAEGVDEGAAPFGPRGFLPSPPDKSSAVVSNIAALENQMKVIESATSLNHTFGMKSLLNGFMNTNRFTINSSRVPVSYPMGDEDSRSPTVSKPYSPVPVAASPARSSSEGHLSGPPERSHTADSQDVAVSVKSERSDSPPQDLTEKNSAKPSVKEESPCRRMFLGRERGSHQSIPCLVSSPVLSPVKTEGKDCGQPAVPHEGHQHLFSFQALAAFTPVVSAGVTSLPTGVTSLLAPAPPRRTPKQHNCNVCGKNFSSASALQIHERTHTGEKPFGCSTCGRAFTTKGNLKVHMGTHMWSNTPARRGRRLSVENPMALLGGEAMKFGEMVQRDLAARALNVDAGFWSRYAAAITNSLTLKNNEISVIQNGGVTQLNAMTAGRESMKAGGSTPLTSLEKTGMELGVNRHYSMLIDDSKDIRINQG